MKNNYINDFLKDKDQKFTQTFEEIFTTYYSISKGDYYENFNYIFLNNNELKKILELMHKKAKGNDLIFEIGFKWFMNNKIRIKKGIFVPQTDSEKFIELVSKNDKSKKFLEIGTGTGALSIALYNMNGCSIEAIDKSKKAIKLSRNNFYLNKKNISGGINFTKINLLKFKPEIKYDVIFTNPPYLSKKDQNISDWVKKNQPKKALYSKNNGSFFLEYIIKNSKYWLKENGKLYLEFGFNQKEVLEKLIKEEKIDNYKFYKDISGQERYLEIYNI